MCLTLTGLPLPVIKTRMRMTVVKKEERTSRRRTMRTSLAADLILLATLRKWKTNKMI